jgi:peptidoglycan/xylan/chitin deacetylase (PgdA/CDA1 family)
VIVGLMYHDVGLDATGFTGAGADRYKLTPERFLEHLDAIAHDGRKPSLVTDPDEGQRIVLTFDDGGRSAATTIAPILTQRGWHGHFFITTERIGSPGFVSEDEIRALAAEGHVVGSHSHTHPVMTTLADARITDEWRRSKAILEDVLAAPVTVLSVPNGFYSARVGRLAAEAGYRHIFTSQPWLRPRPLPGARAYGRFSVLAATPAARVEGLCRFSRRAVAAEAAKWYARSVPKRLLGRHYRRVRQTVLARRATTWKSGEREASR